MQLKGVIFDVDGTICDTLPLHIDAFQQVIREFTGLTVAPDEITAHFGKTEDGIMASLIPRHMPRAYQRYCQLFEENHWKVPEPIPGIKELFHSLAARGIQLGIVTGRGRDTTHITLRLYGLLPYINTIETGSSQSNIKSASLQRAMQTLNLLPAQTIYVGDTPADAAAAMEAGLHFAGAAWASTASLPTHLEGSVAGIFKTVADFADWLDTVLQA